MSLPKFLKSFLICSKSEPQVSYKLVSYKLVSYKLVSYKLVSYKLVSYKQVSYKQVSYKLVSNKNVYTIVDQKGFFCFLSRDDDNPHRVN